MNGGSIAKKGVELLTTDLTSSGVTRESRHRRKIPNSKGAKQRAKKKIDKRVLSRKHKTNLLYRRN